MSAGSRLSVIYCLPHGWAKCCSCALGDLYVGSLPSGGQGSRRSLPCEQAAHVQQTFMVKGGAVAIACGAVRVLRASASP